MRRISRSRYLIEEQREKHWIEGDLRLLIEVVARACKSISIAISKGALSASLGNAGAENVQGEVPKKLDVMCNEIFLEANESGGHLAAMASEEMAGPHQIPQRFPKGAYLLLFDPQDGASNSDVNVSVGTIFFAVALSRRPRPHAGRTQGRRLSAAGFEAGGAASGGRQRILDLAPMALHQRVGLVTGSKNQVERITTYHSQGG